MLLAPIKNLGSHHVARPAQSGLLATLQLGQEGSTAKQSCGANGSCVPGDTSDCRRRRGHGRASRCNGRGEWYARAARGSGEGWVSCCGIGAGRGGRVAGVEHAVEKQRFMSATGNQTGRFIHTFLKSNRIRTRCHRLVNNVSHSVTQQHIRNLNFRRVGKNVTVGVDGDSHGGSFHSRDGCAVGERGTVPDRALDDMVSQN